MKDVSKQTLEDLIKFIYTGEANVAQDNLEEFFDTAKALEINGITDDGNIQGVSNSPSSARSTYNGLQFQSTQTIRYQSQSSTSSYERSSNVYQELDSFDQNRSNEKEENAHGFVGNFDADSFGDGTGYVDASMDPNVESYGQQWNGEYYGNQSDGTPTTMVHQRAKRVKRVVGEY